MLLYSRPLNMALAEPNIQVIISTCVFHVITQTVDNILYVDAFWFLF